jgi:hypothetical protein
MSDYKNINTNAKVQMSVRRKAAIKKVVLVWVVVLTILAAIAGLEAIGFISTTFAIILASITVFGGAFKTGWFWRDVKW